MIQKASLLMEMCDWEYAEDVWLKILLYEPDNIVANYRYGLVLKKTDRLYEAKLLFKKVSKALTLNKSDTISKVKCIEELTLLDKKLSEYNNLIRSHKFDESSLILKGVESFNLEYIFPHIELIEERGIVNYVGLLHKRLGQSAKNFKGSDLLVLDSFCGFRGNPYIELHDSLGYKNEFVPNNADVVVLGNSMVHDLYSPYHKTWPFFLSQSIKGLSVYNASMGGQSVLQYLQSLSEVLFLKPKFVLFNFYFANNVFNSVDTYKQMEPSGYKAFLDFGNIQDIQHDKFKGTEKSKVTFIEQLGQIPRQKALFLGKQEGIVDCVSVEIGSQTFYITPHEAYERINIEKASTKLGFDLVFKALDLLLEMSKKYSFKPIFLIIPSRETVVYKRHLTHSDVHMSADIESVKKVYDLEMVLFEKLQSRCEELGIYFETFLDTISESLPNGYFHSDLDDIHPSECGKESMAGFVSEMMKKYI